MRQIGWVEEREDFWFIVALSRSEDETEISDRIADIAGGPSCATCGLMRAAAIKKKRRSTCLNPSSWKFSSLAVGRAASLSLGAAMKQADMRIDPLHHLAVEFKHEAQDAVRGRMLGAEIDREIT